MSGLTNQGPGSSDVQNSLNSTRSLADMLGQYSQSGGLPTSQDVSRSNDLATSLFGASQVGLNQSFRDQNLQMQQLAARLGRSADDPVLQAKMRVGFMDQQASLDAQKQSWASNYALSQPGQRLNYAQQQSGVLGNLATQAFQNRSALLGVGSQLGEADRAYRINTAQKYSNSDKTDGGGVSGAIAGAMGGIGAGASIGRMFGAGGGGGSTFGSDMFGSSNLSMPSFGSASSYSMPQMSNPFGAGMIPSASSFGMPSFGGGMSQPSAGFGFQPPAGPGYGMGSFSSFRGTP